MKSKMSLPVRIVSDSVFGGQLPGRNPCSKHLKYHIADTRS